MTSSPWSWEPPRKWECFRCGHWLVTRDSNPHCPKCGFQEDE